MVGTGGASGIRPVRGGGGAAGVDEVGTGCASGDCPVVGGVGAAGGYIGSVGGGAPGAVGTVLSKMSSSSKLHGEAVQGIGLGMPTSDKSGRTAFSRSFGSLVAA